MKSNPCQIPYLTTRTLFGKQVQSLIVNHGRSHEILCFVDGGCCCQLVDDWCRGGIGCRNHPCGSSRGAHLQDQIQQEQLRNRCVLYKRKTLNMFIIKFVGFFFQIFMLPPVYKTKKKPLMAIHVGN